MTLLTPTIDFALDESRVAVTPAEHRGTGRDDVRMMVTSRTSQSIEHDHFPGLDRHLASGDVLVVNTSATVPAAVRARTADGQEIVVHFASPVAAGLWSIETRTHTDGDGTSPGPDLTPQRLRLPGGITAHLLARNPRSPRLWIAAVEGRDDVVTYLRHHGEPVRYEPGPRWPIDVYQTVFASEPGSAEMPSAARPFTTELVTRLIAQGVTVLPVVLHAGVSSYEQGETPGEERYQVRSATADVINTLRRAGGRVIAVGTTVVRALETVADEAGVVHPGQGLTDLIVTPERGLHVVDGLLTGWHEPHSSHLTLLETFLPRDHLQVVYDEAVGAGYLWHEFGDELLILP